MQIDTLLTNLLVAPRVATDYTQTQWDLAIRQARKANLLATLAFRLQDAQAFDGIPIAVKIHLLSAKAVWERQTNAVKWEVYHLQKAFESLQVPIVLLKGAAYSITGLPAARGRFYGDIDLIVDKAHLEKCERALFLFGWVSTNNDEYDQAYYRRWMHEIPPVQHIKRSSVIDLHHAILPETSKLKTDSTILLAAIVAVPGVENVYTFSPEDIVLHSITHLFHDGEFENGLRDLVDIDALLRHFAGQDSAYWDRLLARAATLNLSRPLYYGLKYVAHILHTPVPKNIMATSGKAAPIMPWLMDAFFLRALKPNHWSCDDFLTGFSRWILYMRAHYLRMPLYLLIPHLLRKAIKRRLDERKATTNEK